jgi:transposase
MANQRITIQKLRTLLAFHLAGKSQRLIGRQLGIHRRTVSTYLSLLTAHAGGELSSLQDFDESSLWQIVTSSDPSATETALASIDLSTLFPDYEKRLSKVGITKRLLWEDYCLNHNGKLSYSRFCRVFLQWERTSKLSLRMEHKVGDKLFIDFAGNKLYLSDSHNDTKIAVEVFVAVLGYSQLTYCQAVYSQRKADFLSALSNSLTFYGGVPQAIVPDNLKSAVTKADRYEPDLNESMADFGEHYQTTIYPTRSHRPKDKALVEKTINTLYTRVYAALWDKVFCSLSALNEAISALVAVHNRTPFQGKDHCRQSLFDALERDSLSPLPTSRYELKYFRDAKVHPNCHVKLSQDKHHYSVPYKYVGKTVQIRIPPKRLRFMLIINALLSTNDSLPKGGTPP